MSFLSRISRRMFFRSTMGASLFFSTAVAGCKSAIDSQQKNPGEQPGKTRLVDKPQVKRDFSKDGRSNKVILIAHCAINQNARHVDCADFPALMEPLVEALRKNEIGIVQMACPELRVLGMGRDRDMPPLNTIREGLELPQGQARLQELVKDIIYVIKEYRFQGFHIVGILGKNGSPSCGVTRTSIEGKQAPGEGVFIRVLRQALEAENLDIDIKGIDDHAQEKVIAWVEERI